MDILNIKLIFSIHKESFNIIKERKGKIMNNKNYSNITLNGDHNIIIIPANKDIGSSETKLAKSYFLKKVINFFTKKLF